MAELYGYHYKTGVVFAAFVPESGQAIARGGRYDDIGKDFGVARPATGFSADLKTLVSLTGLHGKQAQGIFSTVSNDSELLDFVAKLRAQGERVVMELPGKQGDAVAMHCNRIIVKDGSSWKVKEI